MTLSVPISTKIALYAYVPSEIQINNTFNCRAPGVEANPKNPR